jgi:hypothetical protein
MLQSRIVFPRGAESKTGKLCVSGFNHFPMAYIVQNYKKKTGIHFDAAPALATKIMRLRIRNTILKG